MKSFVFVFIGLFACTEQPEELHLMNNVEDSEEISTVDDTINPNRFPDNYELLTTIYELDSNLEDSTLHCTEYLFIDQTKSKEGKCHYRLPFEIEAMSADLFEKVKKERTLETFDPLICEVGGHSAYNKYVLDESKKERYTVLHFKAWYEDYTDEGDLITNETPSYFLGEKIDVIKTETYMKLSAYNNEGVLMESIENFHNDNGVLIRQKWVSYDKTFVAYYTYSF